MVKANYFPMFIFVWLYFNIALHWHLIRFKGKYFAVMIKNSD